MEFRLLGPVEVVIDGKTVGIAASRQKIVLAMLLLEAGHVVPVPRLIDAIWGTSPPRTARSQVQITVSALRQTLCTEIIATRPPGYMAQLPAGSLDLARFEALVAAAAADAASDQLPEAVAKLREALGLWRGNAAAGVVSAIVEAAATRLNERRIAVLQDCLELELELGRHRQLISELSEVVAEHPLDERFRCQLVLALHRAGRQADALETLRAGRQILREELGLDPGAELSRLERAILTRDPQLAGADQLFGRNGPTSTVPLPRQLPRTISDFAGRDAALRKISHILKSRASAGLQHDDVPIVVLTGRGGTGKTTLAVRAAHLLRPEFPDGQLFIQLRADMRQGVASLLEHLLRTLGIRPDTIPGDVDGREAVYRSWLADRRVLILIDGAISASQVRHFLPGHGGCAVIVTSTLPLPIDGARTIRIGPLDDASARALLTELIGPRRAQAEDEAVSELIRVCEGLPLALRIVGAKLGARPHWRVSQMLEQLRDEERRLDELDLGGVSVRATLSVSYESLGPATRTLFRRLSSLGSYDFASWMCAPLLDDASGRAEDLLQELVQSHLVATRTIEEDSVRYLLHDMVRIYALERLASEEPADCRLASARRLLSCWLHLVTCAHRQIYGGDFGVLHGHEEHWRLPEHVVVAVLGNTSTWFRRERASLGAAIYQAGQLGFDELCWDLAVTSATLFESGFYSEDWRESHRTALCAVRQAGNKRGEAALQCSLGMLELSIQLDTACLHFRQALDLFMELHDRQGEALATAGLAFAFRLRGDYKCALQQYMEALRGFTEVGDLAGQAHTLKTMAQIHGDWQDYDTAEQLLRDSSAISDQLCSPRLAAQVRHQMADLYLRRGELEQAKHAFQWVIGLTHTNGDVIGQLYGLVGLGGCQRRLGDLAGAEHTLRNALDLAGDTDERLVRGRILLELAELDYATGRSNLALARIDEAIGVMQQLGDARIWQARALELLGRLHDRAGRASIAEHAWRSALAMVGSADPSLADQLTMSLDRLGTGSLWRVVPGGRSAWRGPSVAPGQPAAAAVGPDLRGVRAAPRQPRAGVSLNGRGQLRPRPQHGTYGDQDGHDRGAESSSFHVDLNSTTSPGGRVRVDCAFQVEAPRLPRRHRRFITHHVVTPVGIGGTMPA